ncbi:CopD family protein [Paracoccus suum]|uniref:Protoporphyrinogen IX oxidase n=1 Tax=Paracoccus suum TaxID=2259340 RepID=A0A344PHS2_9RHOB|nr:CopD family protein [Paracoccus suum]AXC48927.1 CopD family protein [Paracoccus suum]
MRDGLLIIYPWIKALHVMAVISWMAGLFYLPRLFVYHAERGGIGQGTAEPGRSFAVMEDKLLRVIMNPAMIVTWLAGLTLVATPGVVDWGSTWPWTKAAGVIGMTAFHMWCAGERRRIAAGQIAPGRRYRMMNEVPTLLMIVIVLSVIVRF